MYGIDDSTAVASLPVPEAAGTEGFFFGGDPVNNLPATKVRASFLNMVQQELRNVVVGGGLTPSKTTYNQLLQAIRNIVGVPPVWGGQSTGSANAQAVNPIAPITSLKAGLQINFIAGAQNTASVTLNPSGLGNISVKKCGPYGQINFEGGEWAINDVITVIYDGSIFQWEDLQAYRQNGIGVITASGGWPVVDLNTKRVSGFYVIAQGSPNAPINSYGFLQVIPGGDSNWTQQIFFDIGSDSVFIRRVAGGSWTAWQQISTQAWANSTFATIAATTAAQNTANTGVANAAAAQNTANSALVNSLGSGVFQGGYTDYTSARAFNSVYTNSGTRAMFVSASGISATGDRILNAYVNGVLAASHDCVNNNSRAVLSFVVPPGFQYQINSPGLVTLASWLELH